MEDIDGLNSSDSSHTHVNNNTAQIPRRKSYAPDPQWGIHSVPSMLSDFKRHTSHGHYLTASGNARNLLSPNIEKELRSLTVLGSIPAFLSLPTSLLATEFLALRTDSIWVASALVSGAILVLTGLFVLLETMPNNNGKIGRTDTVILVCGIVGLSLACTTLGSVRVAMTVITALNISIFTAKKQPLILYAIYSALLVVTDLWTLSFSSVVIGYVSLFAACHAMSSIGQMCITPSIALVCGGALLIIGMVLGQGIGLDIYALTVITSGSCGVFLLSRRDLKSTRYNALLSAILASALGIFLKSVSPLDLLLGSASIALPIDNEDTEEEKHLKHGSGIRQIGILLIRF